MEQERIEVNKQRLFVDMDGTLAVFTPVDELETLYQKGYFLNLEPHVNVVEAVRDIINNHPEIDVYILSAYLTDSQYALQEKNEWLNKHLPEIEQDRRIFGPCGSDKKDWIPGGIRESDHLLDDYTRNLNDWQPPARGIKLLNPINHTRGSWQHDRIRYDRTPESLADGIVDIMQGRQRIFDDKITPHTEFKIQNQVLSFYSGQMDAMLSAEGPQGETIGYIKYAEYQEIPYIQYIEVDEKHRRQGVATRLLQELQNLYKGKEIDWGMTTEDGTKLKQSITYVVEDIEVKKLLERLVAAQMALQRNEAQLNQLYEIEEPSQEQSIEIERLGEEWDALNDEIWNLNREIDGRKPEKVFIKMDKENERSATMEQRIKIPPITVDPVVVFFEDERPEEFALYESQRTAAENAWREIIMGDDHTFAGAEFTTPGEHGQTLILTKSIRDGIDFQLTFLDGNNEPVMHEDYYIDSTVDPPEIRDNMRMSLYSHLANYSRGGREITVTVEYEEKEREKEMAEEKDIVKVQSAVRSNYDGYVVLAQFDRNKPVNESDYKLYLGKRENYDNQGNYDNSDNSLVFISENRQMYSFLYGEGWIRSQQEMINSGAFSEVDYAEYAQLKEGVLKQFEGRQIREVKFNIDMDKREQGQESGDSFQYPNWEGRTTNYVQRLEAVYWWDRKSDGEGVVTTYHRENGEIRLIDGMTTADVERRYAEIAAEYGGEIPRITEEEKAFAEALARYDISMHGMESPILRAYETLSNASYPSVRDVHGDEFARLQPAAWGLNAADGTEPYRLVVLTSERLGTRNAPHNIAYNQVMSEEEVAEYRENPDIYLESVYARLGNAGMQPSNYYGHSPSVGDAVVILTPEGVEGHYVASFGFQQEADSNRIITPEQLRAARMGMTVREEYDLLVNLNEAAHAWGSEELLNAVREETIERLEFLHDEYRPVFNLAAVREVMIQERDKLQILEAWEEANNVENPIATYADGMYHVSNEVIRAAMTGNAESRIVVGNYTPDYAISAGERLRTEINHRFERAAREISEGYPLFYRLHASPRPLGDQGQYDFFVQRYERSTTEPGVIPRDIVYVGDSKTAIEVTNHLNAGSEYGEYLEENFELRRQLGMEPLIGDISKQMISEQNNQLTDERTWRVDRVTRAMEAAGYSLDPIDSSAERGVFNGEYGARMEFETVYAAEEWLEGVVFDDQEISDAVEKVMHPERFVLDGLSQQDMIQTIFEYENLHNIPATNDYIPEVDRMTAWDSERSVAVQKPFYGTNYIAITQAVIEEKYREILTGESRDTIHANYTAIVEAQQERMGLEIGGLAGRLQEQAAGDMNRQGSPWGSWFARISHPERPQDYIELDITGYSTRNSVIESATLVLNGNVHEQLEMDEMPFDDYGNEEGFDTGFAGKVAELAQHFDPFITENYVLYAPAGWSEHSLDEHYQMLKDRGLDDMPNWDAYNARVREEAALAAHEKNINERSENVAEQEQFKWDERVNIAGRDFRLVDTWEDGNASYAVWEDLEAGSERHISGVARNGQAVEEDLKYFDDGRPSREEVMAKYGKQEKIRVAIESTDDHTEPGFHQELIDTDIQNEDGSYGKVKDYYRIAAINENGRIAAFDDRVFKSSAEARAAVAELPGLELVSYDELVHEAADIISSRTQAERAAQNASISFYVAESMEFENLGEYREGLTLQEAFEIYDSIPSERLNGGKGIGFNLQDGSIYSGNFALLLGNEVQDYVINEIDHFRNSPLVQQALQDFKAEFDRRNGLAQNVQQEVNSSFIAHYYVVEDIQARGPLAVQNHSDLNQALAAYTALPSDKMKALGIENTNELPGSLDIVHCKDGVDTIVEDYQSIDGWNNPEILAAVEQITEALEENAAIKRREQDEIRMDADGVDRPVISIGNNECTKVDEWTEGNNRYLMGNSVEDNTFYYAIVNDNPAYMFEYDEKPTREQIEGNFIDREAERAIDEHEAEFGADGRRTFPNLNAEPEMDEAVYRLDDNQYLYIQTSEEGYDYTIYAANMREQDGGGLDNPDLTMVEARDEILALHDMQPEKIEAISIEEYERIGYEAERRNRPLTYSENEALVKLAERIDNFMYDYDTYNYHDDVGNTLEERSEHRAHLASALENREFSPMIDSFRNIIAEEEAALTPDTETISQAQAILHDLTHLEEYQRNYAAQQQETGEVRDPMLNLAARLDNFAYDAHPQEYSQSWNWEMDDLAADLRAGNVDAAAQWLNSAERYLTATNDENRNAALIREVHDLSYALQHLDQYQQFYGREVAQNAEHPIQEFVREGRTLEGSQIPGRNIPANTIGHSDRATVFHAVQDFEVDNSIPFNQREIHNGTYEDKEFLYAAYDRYVGMSHRNDLSIQPYMERLTAMAEDKSKHISLLPLVAEVYYAQQNGLTPEQIDYVLDSVQNDRIPLESIKNLRHAYENGLTQEQITVLAGEDSFAQEALMGYMAGGGSIENAMALKGCDVAQYYILSSHLNEGSFGPDMAKAVIQAGNSMKDWNEKDFDRQKAEGVENIKWRFSMMDFEFFTEYLAEAAMNDKSITPEMIAAIGKQFVEQNETNNLRKFIENSGGFQSFDAHREEAKTSDKDMPEEDKFAQEGVELPAEKKDPKELLNEQLQQGVQNVLNSENFKNWLDTSSKMFLNNYSFNNAILVWCQRPDATHTMGYEQWKEYGRNVAKGAEGIKIFVPVIAYEKKDGDLWRMIKGKLQTQMKADPTLPQAAFRIGMSKLEITMNRNGLYGLRVDGKERGIKSEKDMQNFIKHSVLGKVPMYFTVGTVFDAKDTITPEHLWMKKGFTKAEMVKDEDGKPIKNRRGEYKIINTPERQAKFQPSLDMKVPEIKRENAAILYDALKAVSERNGIHVYEKARAEDETLRGGADGYFSREFSDTNPKGYIVMPTDLEPTKAVSVMLHEMSHSELHGDLTKLAQQMGEEKIPSTMREVQAEAVAYVVGKNFGIESDISSFNYLAAYSKGFELQALSKSIEVIYKECRQLTSELKTELEVRGLNMDLTERGNTPMEKEAVESLAKTYVGYALEQNDRIADIEKELPTIAEQNADKKNILAVIVAQASNINRQKEDVALILEKVGALETASTFAEQKDYLTQIEAAKNRVENYKGDFTDLSVQFQELTRNEQGLKDRFVADPVATIDSMKQDYPQLGQLTTAQTQYLAKSEYVSRELAPMLRTDPAQFAEKASERASQIDKVASKNGMFVEVIFCEQWTDKPIVENGALMHPKVADTVVKQAETQIRGLRAKAESVGDYFPYSKCALTVYQAEKGQITKAFQTRVDIGDGAQASLTDHLKQISSAKGIAADFEKATREKGAKEKILFNDAQKEDQAQVKPDKAETVVDKTMTRDEWEKEINAARKTQNAEQEENQPEKSGHKRSGQGLDRG